MTNNSLYPVLIFDMDGVILDTERLVCRCWHELGEAYQLTDIDEVFLTTVGTTRKHTGEILCAQYGADFPQDTFNADISRLFHSIADVEGIPVKTGAREALAWASEQGFRIGLATSTRQVTAETELKHAGLYQYFDYILGGDRITRSKPFPDIYLTACHNMGIAPSDAFAIEDSYNGIRAASQAGMHPIMVPDILPPTEEMHQLCRTVLPDLTALPAFLQHTYTNECLTSNT
ncbi:MAG: HAD family phosphatase [Eubacteriales bacterium]|nr:HAD family phosphatase [Eubacteriales bacterium]